MFIRGGKNGKETSSIGLGSSSLLDHDEEDYLLSLENLMPKERRSSVQRDGQMGSSRGGGDPSHPISKGVSGGPVAIARRPPPSAKDPHRPAGGRDTNQLPLAQLQEETIGWASSGIRGVPSRQAQDSGQFAVDTGLFVSPTTVVAALPTGVQGLVLTLESGGWLRVRETQGGLIRHQQRLHGKQEGTSLCWITLDRRPMLVVGCLGGLLQLWEWQGEVVSYRLEAASTDATPVVQLVSLAADRSGRPGAWVVSLDVLGRLRCWHLTDTPLELTEEAVLVAEQAVVASAGACSPMCLLLSGYGEATADPPASAHLLQWSTHSRSWRPLRYYGPLEEEKVTLTALCAVRPRDRPPQLWAGTERGTVWCWELLTGRPLHHLQLDTACPVHDLSTANLGGGGATELSVWACQVDGRVSAYSPSSFRCLERLPLSYPPVAAGDELRKGGKPSIQNAVDLLRSQYHLSRSAHFSLFLVGLESVHMYRVWTAATDGTVRTCLVPSERTEGTTLLEAEEVKRFIQDKAEAMVRLQTAHAEEVSALQAEMKALQSRCEQYQEALKQAQSKERAAQETASAAPRKRTTTAATQTVLEERLARESDEVRSPRPVPQVLARHSDEVLSPSRPPPRTSRSPSPKTVEHVTSLQGLLERLGERMEETLFSQEMLQKQITAYRLRTLEEAAAEEEARTTRSIAVKARRGVPRRPVPLRSPTPEDSPIRLPLAEEEPIHLVSVFSSDTPDRATTGVSGGMGRTRPRY